MPRPEIPFQCDTIPYYLSTWGLFGAAKANTSTAVDCDGVVANTGAERRGRGADILLEAVLIA